MLVECKSCGAPLDVPAGARVVRCSYCGASNRVQSMRTVMEQTPAGWAPPEQWTPPPYTQKHGGGTLVRQQTVKQPKRLTGCIPIIAALGLLVPAGVIAGRQCEHTPGFLGGLQTEGAGSLATVDLETTPLRSVRGETDDAFHASGLNGSGVCRGYIPQEPHVLLRSGEGARVTLAVESSADTVMVLRTADGAYTCDDDGGNGLNAQIETVLPAGEHRVWVGTFSSGTSTHFELSIQGVPSSAQTLANGLAPDAPPVLGVMAESGNDIATSYTSDVHPSVDISTLGTGCRGYVAPGPHLVIAATEVQPLSLRTQHQSGDPVLLVRHPDGRFECDDDGAGHLDSALSLQLDPGRTAIWVGGFSQNRPLEFTLSVNSSSTSSRRRDSVDLNAAPALGLVNLDVPGWATEYAASTRPELAATPLGSGCTGRIGRHADLLVVNTTPRPMQVSAFSSTGANLTLAVHGPDGSWACDDDAGEGTNPMVRQVWAPGSHHIWVGVHGRTPAPFQLHIGDATD